VEDQSVDVKADKVVSYRVHLMVTFVLEE